VRPFFKNGIFRGLIIKAFDMESKHFSAGLEKILVSAFLILCINISANAQNIYTARGYWVQIMSI
jgi:hypothetical protein